MTVMKASAQLPLDLSLKPAAGREAFLITEANRAAFRAVECWRDWPRQALALTGPAASGKSHLLCVWREAAGAIILDGRNLREEDARAALDGVPVAIDNAGAGMDECALFHLLNGAREAGAPVLLASRARPESWKVGLADLASRLAEIPVVEMAAAPDDALLRALLRKQLADRGLIADKDLLEYAATRMERSYRSARLLVEAVDRAALSAGTTLTKRLIGETLANFANSPSTSGGDALE